MQQVSMATENLKRKTLRSNVKTKLDHFGNVVNLSDNLGSKREFLYLLSDLRNFNEIFRKDGIYDNVKSHKKPALQIRFRRHIFGKNFRMRSN